MDKASVRLTAGLALEEGSEKRFMSWGDHCWWDIDMIRDAIVNRYGNESVSEVKKDEQGRSYFDHLVEVDFDLVGKDLGVSYSCVSSSSEAE